MNNTNCRSLLPPNRSNRETVLEAAACARLNNIPLPIRDLMSAENCPTALLNILADSLSVDYWESEWNEDVKRDIIAASLSVHWRKGTDGAVYDALEALGITAEIVHWWQSSPQGERGTMSITAYANKNLNENADTFLSPDLLNQVRKVIKYAKRGAIHASVAIGARFTGEISLSNAATVTKLNVQNAEAQAISPNFNHELTLVSSATRLKISATHLIATL